MSASAVAAAGIWLVLRARGRRRQLAWALVPLAGRERAALVARAPRSRGDADRAGGEPQRDAGVSPAGDAAAAPRAARRRARHPRAGRGGRRRLRPLPLRLGRGAPGPALRDPADRRRTGGARLSSGAAAVPGGRVRARRVSVPGTLGPAHDPPADAALSPGRRARGLGRFRGRGDAPRLGAGARARRAPPRARDAPARDLAPHQPRRSALRARGPRAGASAARDERRAPRLRLLRAGVPPDLGERRARRRLAALERPLPPLAAAAARRGALRQERRLGADAHGAVRPSAARRVRAARSSAWAAAGGARARARPWCSTRFVPPFAPSVEPWPDAGAAGDADLRTFVAPAPGAAFELRLPEPRALVGDHARGGARRPAAAAQRRRAGERRRAALRDRGQPSPARRAPGPALAERAPAGGDRPRRDRDPAWRAARWWRCAWWRSSRSPGASARCCCTASPAARPGTSGCRRAPTGKRAAERSSRAPLGDREDWYSRVLLAARHRPPP